MTILSTESANESSPCLIIKVNTCFRIGSFYLQVIKYLGQFADVHYFQVNIHNPETTGNDDDLDLNKAGLLRVGAVNGCLNLERQLRQVLGVNKVISELLISTDSECVSIDLVAPDAEVSSNETALEINSHPSLINTETKTETETQEKTEPSTEYLEEEFFLPQSGSTEFTSPSPKIIVLSYLPNSETTLSAWLKQEHSWEMSLSLSIQMCQFFQYVYQQGWCFININPDFIQVGTPIQFFDLAGISVVGEKLQYGLSGDYCASEMELGYAVDEQISTYIIGVFLYQSLHHKLPNLNDNYKIKIKPIPLIYQIIHICLASIEERFTLSQLLSLLRQAKQLFSQLEIKWNVSSRSILGLSLSRLKNEDSHGFKQHYFNESGNLILGIVADGMGGMAQGDVASSLAVKTILEEPIPISLNGAEDWNKWLKNIIQKANERVVRNVRNGGTTLSLILAMGRELIITHIGDSRIFLLRNSYICQLSEDHSLVAMLLASGEITYAESHDHPERSVLLKSIGTKHPLNNNYIQDLTRFGSDLSMQLENDDILLICSDGVWDLVSSNELAEIFINHRNLESAVNETIDRVISRGASDNATILALQCSIEKYYE